MGIQLAELHYPSPPSLDAPAIAERAESLIHSGIQLPEDLSGPLLFFHTSYTIDLREGAVPAQTTILPSDKRSEPSQYAEELQQSWACEDAQERLQACTSSCLVTEMMTRVLDPADRLLLFHGILQATVELTKPHAIVFKHSQQVISPESYLASCEEAPFQRPGSVNVRFFRIANSNHEDMLMDTRGLEEIGLHDLQCHFRDLDPNAVSRILYNLALYIAQKGPVIESGHTIPGIEPESKWRCQFEQSLLPPEREVLDLNPGSPYAAGNRES